MPVGAPHTLVSVASPRAPEIPFIFSVPGVCGDSLGEGVGSYRSALWRKRGEKDMSIWQLHQRDMLRVSTHSIGLLVLRLML